MVSSSIEGITCRFNCYDRRCKEMLSLEASERRGSLSPPQRKACSPRRGGRRALYGRGRPQGEDGSAVLSSVAAVKSIDSDEALDRVPAVSS